MLLVVNPRASSFSRSAEAAVVGELGAAFELETAHTESPEHALALSRDAVQADRHAVVAVLGGDGAVNEVANGLAGTEVVLAPLPGGRTNAFCRIVGMPDDPLQAAVRLREIATHGGAEGAGRALPARRVDLGTMNGRHFTFASGVGLTAVANHRLNSHGISGQRLGGAVFVLEALATAADYLRRPPRLLVEAGDRSLEGLSLVAQNADPLSYLGGRPLPLCEGVGLETGTISLAVLERASIHDALFITGRVVAGRGPRALERNSLASLPRLVEARVRTPDGRPLPVEVDGDYVGEAAEIEYGVAPRALRVVAPDSAAGDRDVE
jgi:diacylglycerol kinase family enzyme